MEIVFIPVLSGVYYDCGSDTMLVYTVAIRTSYVTFKSYQHYIGPKPCFTQTDLENLTKHGNT